MTLTASRLITTIQSIVNDLKSDVFMRFNYNLDENITYLDLTRNLLLLENVISTCNCDSVRASNSATVQDTNPISHSHNLNVTNALNTTSQLRTHPILATSLNSHPNSTISSPNQTSIPYQSLLPANSTHQLQQQQQQQQQQVLGNNHINSQLASPEFLTTYNSPFNIQNQENILLQNSLESVVGSGRARQFSNPIRYSPHEIDQIQQQYHLLASSEQKLPQFHQELLKEYKNSVNELKKQNKIIKAIVQEHGIQNNNNNNYQSTSSSHNSAILDRNYREGNRTPSLTPYNSNHHYQIPLNYISNNNQASSHNYHPRLQTFETGEFSILSTEQKREEDIKINKTKQQKRRRDDVSTEQLKRIELAARATKELQELQRLREKEIHRVRQIEKAIKRREEFSQTAVVDAAITLAAPYTRQQNKQSSSAITTPTSKKRISNDPFEIHQTENRPHQTEKRSIRQINEQINTLDKEIRSITQYIQNCIISDS